MDIKFPRFSLNVPSPMFLIFIAWLVVHTENRKTFKLPRLFLSVFLFNLFQVEFFMTKICLIEKLLSLFSFLFCKTTAEKEKRVKIWMQLKKFIICTAFSVDCRLVASGN